MLFEILSENHKKSLLEKYAVAVMQVATLEERISTLMNFGMVDEAKRVSETLVEPIEVVKKEFIDENPKK